MHAPAAATRWCTACGPGQRGRDPYRGRMELTGLGGGILLAIAAALWLLYLVPHWLKRREYLATERNAVRLQQTIRVLAETAEIPDAVRTEIKARRLAAVPVAVGRPATLPLPVEQDPRALAARRLRRTRVVTTLILLASAITLIAQLVLMLATGIAASAWIVLGAAGLTGMTALALLGRLAEVSRARSRQRVPVERAPRRTTLGYGPSVAAPQPAVRTEWTPMPLPKPLYLSRAEASAAPVAAGEDLAAAAAEAQRLLRERALAEAERAAAAPEPAPTAPSRFAAMGVIDERELRRPDLDEVLARRRAV